MAKLISYRSSTWI